MSQFKTFLTGFQNGLKEFGSNISVLINSLLLTVVYFFGIGLTAIIGKIFKNRFLKMSVSKKEKSYWQDFDSKKESLENHYQQF